MENVNGLNMYGIQKMPEVKNVQKSSYQPKVDLSDPVDSLQLSTKQSAPPKASTGKKIGLGIASALIPGLGQLVDGDGKKAAKYFLTEVGASVAGYAALALIGPSPIGLAVMGLSSVVGVINYIGSIVDAAKNAKP